MTDREACIVLNLIPGIGSARLEALIEHFSSPAAILEQAVGELEQVRNIPGKLAEKIANWRGEIDPEAEQAVTDRAGATLITRYDPEYPEILKGIYDPPICLYVRGTLPDFNCRSVAIVGSRRVSIYGRKMARLLAESASYADWTVVSGLAFGVDAIAHQATIDTNGVTVAVLGGGLARIHPQEHIPLARAIVDKGGAIISEYPMNYPVSRQSFPRRNRIVSGLSQAVVVVEAGLNSGALLTANIAADQGKSVFAVPGQADNPQAKGCHQLIKTGAKLTESFDDILEDFEFLPGFAPVQKLETGDLFDDGAFQVSENLNPDELAVVNILNDGEKSVDQIAAGTSLATGKLLSLMMKLELKKLVKQLPGQLFGLNR